MRFLLLASCVVRFQPDASAQITCTSVADCPDATWTCDGFCRNSAVPAIIVESAGAETSETGATTTFAVRLTKAPTANVVIALSVSVPAEASVSPMSLTFGVSDWDATRIVTVAGLPDCADDGDVPFMVALAPAVSDDPEYADMDATDLSFVNRNAAQVPLIVEPKQAVTSELGAGVNITVRLPCDPGYVVSIDATSSDASEGVLDCPGGTCELTFTDWSQPKTVRVVGVDDLIEDGPIAYEITGLSVQMTNTDAGDIAGFTLSSLPPFEEGASSSFMVKLTSEPVAQVLINVTASGPTGVVTFAPTVALGPSNWNVGVAVAVSGVDNGDYGDNPLVQLVLEGDASNADVPYRGLRSNAVNISLFDDERGVFAVGPFAGSGLSNALILCETEHPLTQPMLGTSPFTPGTIYFRAGNPPLRLGIPDSSGVFALPLENALASVDYWTGVSQQSTAGDNCDNWTDDAQLGAIGFAESTNESAFFGNSVSCTEAHYLLCVEY